MRTTLVILFAAGLAYAVTRFARVATRKRPQLAPVSSASIPARAEAQPPAPAAGSDANEEDSLDAALEMTFPASDPVAMEAPLAARKAKTGRTDGG